MDGTKTSGVGTRMLRIPLRAVNAYLLQGERGAVLVDTGFPGTTGTVLKKISRRGVDPEEISLIVLTHGHPDHAGSAAELRKRLRVPVAIHALEAGWMRSGLPEVPRPIRAFGRLIKPLLRSEIPAFEPDILLEGKSLRAKFTSCLLHKVTTSNLLVVREAPGSSYRVL